MLTIFFLLALTAFLLTILAGAIARAEWEEPYRAGPKAIPPDMNVVGLYWRPIEESLTPPIHFCPTCGKQYYEGELE